MSQLKSRAEGYSFTPVSFFRLGGLFLFTFALLLSTENVRYSFGFGFLNPVIISVFVARKAETCFEFDLLDFFPDTRIEAGFESGCPARALLEAQLNPLEFDRV